MYGGAAGLLRVHTLELPPLLHAVPTPKQSTRSMK